MKIELTGPIIDQAPLTELYQVLTAHDTADEVRVFARAKLAAEIERLRHGTDWLEAALKNYDQALSSRLREDRNR